MSHSPAEAASARAIDSDAAARMRAARRRRRGVAVLMSCALVLGGSAATPGDVAAHAELVSSSPPANASLVEPPAELVLRFSEPVDPATAVVELLAGSRDPLPGLGQLTVTDGDRSVTVTLPDLEPGLYTVSYQVVSAVDGHATSGIYAFLVDPSGTEAPPTSGATSSSPSVDAATVAARWVALAAALLAVGTLIFWFHAGLPLLGAPSGTVDRRPPWLLVAVAAAVTFGALAVYLGLAARPILSALGGGHGGHPGTGFPLDFAAPFGWTPFAIAMRVAVFTSLAAFVVPAWRWFWLQDGAARPGGDERLAMATTALLLATLAGMSAAGHVAAIGGPAFAVLDWIHLVSVAAWLGGLPAAFVLARRARGASREMLGAMLRRHGRLALVAGPVTALTGIANSPIVLGTARDLVASAYGNLLIAKGVLLSVALGIGAVNHLALRGHFDVNRRLLVGTEVAVGLVAVMAAATMVTIQPAAARQPVLVAPPAAPAHLYGSAGPASVHVAVSAASPGVQTYQVQVSDHETGAPRDDVQKVFLTFVPPAADLPPERIELEPGDRAGIYGTVGAHTPIDGAWELEVTVRRAGALDESTTFELPVTTPAAPQLVPPPHTGASVPPPLGVLWTVLPAGLAGWVPSVVLLGAVAGATWWARRPHSPQGLSAARVLLLAALAVAVLGAGSRAMVTAANEPAGPDASRPNPIEATKESVERGERLYLANCAACHGVAGDGDGAVATLPRPRPLDATVPALSDGELSYRIANGMAGTPMPAFAESLTPDERWDLVNYLRSRWDDSSSQARGTSTGRQDR